MAHYFIGCAQNQAQRKEFVHSTKTRRFTSTDKGLLTPVRLRLRLRMTQTTPTIRPVKVSTNAW